LARHLASPIASLHALALVTAALFSSAPALAAPLDIQLGFASLPSAQGFTYSAVGAHAGVAEATVFSVSGGVLTQNTIGQSNGITGGSIFYQITGIVTTTEAKQIRVRARVLQSQGSANDVNGLAGLFFGFNTGAVQYGFGLTPTRVAYLGGGVMVLVAGTFDNSTLFHDYVFDWTPPNSWQIRRDGVLIQSGTTGFAFASSRLMFGDGSGGANAHAEITAYRFLQGVPTTSTEPTTWGSVKGLYR